MTAVANEWKWEKINSDGKIFRWRFYSVLYAYILIYERYKNGRWYFKYGKSVNDSRIIQVQLELKDTSEIGKYSIWNKNEPTRLKSRLNWQMR